MSAGEHFEFREDKVWFERFGASSNSLLFRMKTKVPPVGTLPTSFHTTLSHLMPLATLPLLNPVVCVFFFLSFSFYTSLALIEYKLYLLMPIGLNICWLFRINILSREL